MFKHIFLFILFFLVFPLSVQSLLITEIMYDPKGNDNNREYVEVFTEKTSLEEYKIEDLASSDTLQLAALANSSYSLIVEDGFNYSNINATIYTIGKTIGNNLNNDRDLILLRDNTSKIKDVVVYTSKQGGKNNNKSLCRKKDSLYECAPTPGEADKGQNNKTSKDYELIINEFLPNPIGDDRAPLPEGEWAELYNEGAMAHDLRGLILYDKGNNHITLSDVHFVDDAIIKPGSYKVVYLNGKSILNNNGFEEFGIKLVEEVIDQVSYDGSKEGVSWSRDAKGFFRLSVPTKREANLLEEASLETNISIENIYTGKDKQVKFGELLRIRLKIYKGETTKNSIKVYLENITKQTTFNVYTKFNEYSFVLPLQIDPNCQGKHAAGSYRLVVDGLDVSVFGNVTVAGINQRLCVKVKENKTVKQSVSKKKVSLQTQKNDSQGALSDTFINKGGELVYESSDKQAKRYALYFFCLVLICIVGAYIFDIRS